ncbi:uncharacterized protein DUF4233 [Sediminihabitans luteus]|uniref:Uncharacterized protein DUF4233 n=1 Tax=Sediminihabitans luteus TaxID=1138585 RepID=A0A2M9CC84_9CELL|nr:DUF4233 domain-containing protein [Sediminihabitans luteus]PJJ68974.1 uncharacterized protein DUF4233 [Sediminihabitans luteus]GII99357.1 hypothetical protein Slu03_17350 [Sediminihabitans luteus]
MSPTTPTPSASSPEADGAPRIRAKKPALPQFTSTTLVLEAFVVLFATFAAYALTSVPSAWPDYVPVPTGATVWAVGGALVVVLMVLSRMVGSPGGYVAGSVAQVPVLATGVVLPLMYLVGAIFVALWIASLVLGRRIDRERAEYDAAHPETAPNV